MNIVQIHKLRKGLKFLLNKAGLLPTARRLRRLATKPLHQYREDRKYRYRFLQFKRQYGHVLRHNLNSSNHDQKIALISSVHFPEVEIELALIKALELAGFVPVILIQRERWLHRKYYKVAGIKGVYLWSEFSDALDVTAADAAIDRFQTVQDLVAFEYEGTRVGRFAFSSALRSCRLGSLGLDSDQDRHILTKHLASAMSYAKAAQRIVEKFDPQLAVLIDREYTPKGELFDHCLTKGVKTITYGIGRQSSLVFKRFSLDNRDTQGGSLSEESWKLIREMEWADDHRAQLQQEIYCNYASSDWWSPAGIQANKRFIDAHEIRNRLSLDPGKKTAFIFTHISWDAPLYGGKSLFVDYEEWLIETVRAACANDRINWVIKIHPGHVGLGVREGFKGEIAEVMALRKHIGKLPRHVFVMPADDDISTYSLFELMDYCLTVRGTVGIEAAMLGIPVLTAGAGRYDHRGFTIDSDSREQYLERVANIQIIPRLSPGQKELAERFAYGLFVLRRLPLTTATLTYDESYKKELSKARINIRTKDDWYRASDIRAIAEWVTSGREDFLMPPPNGPC